MEVKDIKIDGFAGHIGIDGKISVSWRLEGEGENAFQKSYRIKVKKLEVDILDTGRTKSSCHTGIELGSLKLKSFEKYNIQVSVEDLAGNWTKSEWVSFVTGAFNQEEFQGKWIGNGDSKPFYARKELTVPKSVSEAYALVCGLGQFIFYINGNKVGNHELDPGWTNYNKRVQYVMFDIKQYLQEKENVFGVSVGNGFYLADSGGRYFFEMPPEAMKKFMPPNTNKYEPFGTALALKAMIILKYEDGGLDIVATDRDWKVCESACTLANVYGSEIYDARRYPKNWNKAGYDDKSWNFAKEVQKPVGKPMAQGQPPIVVKRTYEAVLLEKQEEGYLYDLGQNMSCMLELSVKGKTGSRVDMLVAEKLDADGRLDQMAKNWNMIDVSCTYILEGNPDGESWRQEFSYVGARYVLVKGAAPMGTDSSMPQLISLKGHYIVSDSPVTGTFWCDDERYNRVYDLIAQSVDSNLKSVHTDCPSIEKTAWLEESHFLAPSIMFYRDVRDLWIKIFDDAVGDQYTTQTVERAIDGKPFYRGEGFLPPIAPSYGKMIADTPLGNFWDLIAWGSLPILGAKWYYEYYGTTAVIEKYYGACKRYMDYLASRLTADGFIAHGLGDWGNPQQGAQATANVETAYYYEDLVVMAEFADLLGRSGDRENFSSLALEVCKNYNEKLLVQDEYGKWCYNAWDHKEDIFCTQSCQALPLYFGMVPKDKKGDVFDKLINLLENSGFMSGEVGFPAILRCLQEAGRQELMWELAMSEDAYSYYHFVLSGETTLCEYWEDNPRSHNHDMMGSLMECYYTDIAGIKNLGQGFAKVLIKPHLPKGVHQMKCSYKSVQGGLCVEIGENAVHITVPAGTCAEVDLSEIGIGIKKELVPGRYKFEI